MAERTTDTDRPLSVSCAVPASAHLHMVGSMTSLLLHLTVRMLQSNEVVVIKRETSTFDNTSDFHQLLHSKADLSHCTLPVCPVTRYHGLGLCTH